MRYYLILLLILILSSCGGGSYSSSNGGNSGNEVSTVTEDISSARQQGYNQGYDDGYRAGYDWKQHGVYYNDQNNYQSEDGQNTYKRGYSEGYDEGYSEGEAKIIAEREAERMKDPHNWESEDVDGLYIYLDGVEDDDVADYIARENYEGEYIRGGWDYYAKVSQTWGEYEVTLGERASSHLYKIRGTDIYIHFKWLPDVSSGDEGVLDWSGTFSTFYKKPD